MRPLRGTRNTDTWIGLGAAICALLVYLATFSQSVGSMDSGELATAAHTLGVAHPTGYPLYLLLAKSFSLIAYVPFSDFGVIVSMNFLAALLGAAAVFLVYFVFLRLLSRPGSTENVTRIASATAALSLGFSRTVWAQATTAEVYALHLIFLSILLLLFLPSRKDVTTASTFETVRITPLFAYVLGLSFANHMLTVLLAPAFLVLLFRGYGFGRRVWTEIARVAPAFALGLSVYLYLPIRAATRPVMNWGDPSSWETFWNHVTAAQFREWMFSSVGVAVRQLFRFLIELPLEFAVLPLAFAAWGLWRMRRESPEVFRFSLLLFGACVVYAINYDIPDPDAYFLQAYLAIALWVAWGLRALIEGVAAPRRRLATFATFAGIAALVLVPLAVNFGVSDQRSRFGAEDYARNVLQNLEPNAILFSDAESSFYFTTSWLQFVEGVRPDVVVVGFRALAFPWHHVELEARHPGFLNVARPEVSAYLGEKKKFDRGEAADSAVFGRSFITMTRAVLQGHFGKRPLYVTPDVDPALIDPWRAAPDGLALRVFAGDSLPNISSRTFRFRPLDENDPETPTFRRAFAAATCYQGVYQALRGDTAQAVLLMHRSLALDSTFPDAASWLERWGRR